MVRKRTTQSLSMKRSNVSGCHHQLVQILGKSLTLVFNDSKLLFMSCNRLYCYETTSSPQQKFFTLDFFETVGDCCAIAEGVLRIVGTDLDGTSHSLVVATAPSRVESAIHNLVTTSSTSHRVQATEDRPAVGTLLGIWLDWNCCQEESIEIRTTTSYSSSLSQ